MKIKWQGSHPKRACHAFLIDKKSGEASLCGREPLTSNGVMSDEPIKAARQTCSNCLKKVEKLINSTKE